MFSKNAFVLLLLAFNGTEGFPSIVVVVVVVVVVDVVVVVVVVVVRRALDVTQRLRGRQCTVGHDGYNFTAWPGRAS